MTEISRARQNARYAEDFVNVKDFGATGDGVTDDLTAFQAARDSGASSIYVPSGTYLLSDRIELPSASSGQTWRGDGYDTHLKLSGTFTANKGLFWIPGNGDSDGGTADGATNITIRDMRLDGSAATMSSGVSGGIRLQRGADATFKNLWCHDFTKNGILVGDQAVSGESNVLIENVYCYNISGTGGQGISLATVNEEAGRIIINNAWCYDNAALGVDASTGSCTLNNVHCWGNTSGGMKLAGSDNQHVVLSNCNFSDNTATNAQGFYTNGSFKLLEINNCLFERNNGPGIQIAHAGRVMVSNTQIKDNLNIGFYTSGGSPDIHLSNVHVENSSQNGYLLASGNIIASNCSSKENEQRGFHVTTSGYFIGSAISSVDDCTASQATGINFQPASTNSDYCLNSAVVVDTRGGSATINSAVTLNSNVDRMYIGAVHGSGWITTPLSDSGVNTVYIDRGDGRTKLGHDRVGFYGSSPLAKQTVTGAHSSNAALQSLLTALSNLGLITDSST